MIATGGTIVATATAAGAGFRGAVRMSGPDAIEAAGRCSEVGVDAGVRPTTVRTALGDVPVIAMVSRAPASFTGEDGVEFSATGHPAVLDAIVAALLGHPRVRRAGPGEFTARAFLAGKIDLLEAEAIAIAVSVASEDERAAARSVARGGLGDSARHAADRLSGILAGIEAGIDFTDEEDVVPVPPERLAAALDEVERIARAELAPRVARSAGRGRVPRAAIVGPTNAGKSSLFNALVGRERSVIAPIRGTTRDAIIEELALPHDGRLVRLAIFDLAGEGDSEDPLDAAARRRREETVAEADVIVRCVPPGDRAPDSDPRTIVVATKSDLAPPPPGALATSVRTGRGLDRLRQALAERAVSLAPRESIVDAVTDRHVEALGRTLAALARARELVPRLRRQPELVAAAVAEAVAPLRELTGVGTPDDVLARIFASFCIGK